MPAERISIPEKLAEDEEVAIKLKGEIVDFLRAASRNSLESGHNQMLIFHDQSGHYLEYLIDKERALDIDKALWSAGEDMTIENLRENIFSALKKGEFNLASTAIELVDETRSRRQAA